MQLHRSLCFSLVLAAGTTGAFAQSAGPSSAEKPVFQWGGDFRLRYEAYDSAHTLRTSGTNERDYFRARLRLWETTNPFPSLSLFGRVSAEPRYWFNAATTAGEGKEWKYAIVDNLHAKWRTEAADTPLTVVLGRQDIQLGDQWLITDGTPLDGSWTNHFDGLRLTFGGKDAKTTIDVLAFDQQAKPGDRLPILGSDRKAAALLEQDETAVVVYVSNKSTAVQLDGYVAYKADDAVTTKGFNADLVTIGARAAGSPEEHWQYSVEAAYQFGRRNDASGAFTSARNHLRDHELSREVSAYGGLAKLTYSFKDTYKNQLTFSAEYLSGDKSGTAGKDEMFDVLWGRTPRVSEVWAVAMAQETGRNAQYSNLFRLSLGWSIAPTKNTSVAANYSALFAPEDTPTRSTSPLFTRDGNFRGQVFQLVVKQKFTKQISGLLLAEYCPMGDFYTHTDAMTFLRTEVQFAF